MVKERTQQNSLAVYFREFTDMPVITYPSSYSPSVNHHSISSAGHTLPKYSSATSSSLNNSYSKYHSSSYNVNSSPKTYTSSNFSRQLNNFKDYKTPISSSSLNYLPNKTNSHISPNKYNGTSSSLSSTPRSSISTSSPSSSSSSSNGSISSYNNNGIASSITLTHYQRRKNSISDDFNTSINSLKPSTNNFPKIPSPKWKRKSDYQVDWQSIIPKELSGLTNLGNTCYMNSVLQAMYCTDVFRKFVLTNSNKSPLLNSLYKLFDEMQDDKSNVCVYPGMFRNQFIKQQPKFRGYAQQDAQEFLRYLINGIHDEVNQARSSLRPKNLKSPTSSAEAWQQYKYIDDSPLIDMVAGQLSSTITCTICQYSSTCYDPFLDLSLSLPAGSECNVQKCLQDFTAVELLAPDELIKCERCNKQTRCTKKLSIVKLPTILILHLKRFSNEGYKLTNPRVKPEETLIINNKPFSLYSIVCHHGYSSRSGHYTAYCHYKDKWYNFNDDRITESTRFETENCEDAYILFYVDKEKDKSYVSNYISRL